MKLLNLKKLKGFLTKEDFPSVDGEGKWHPGNHKSARISLFIWQSYQHQIQHNSLHNQKQEPAKKILRDLGGIKSGSNC